jgi:hypothetical protein
MADIIEFDIAKFRLDFPIFTNPPYTDLMLETAWAQATCYISNLDCGWLRGDCRRLALNLMTAHLAYIGLQIDNGQTTGTVQTATIDKVTIGLVAPPVTKSYYAWWATSSPYGQQLYALLSAKSVGGFYIPGPNAYARTTGWYY